MALGRSLWAGYLRRKRLRLYDRQAVVQNLTGCALPQSDKTVSEPKRFMAIISAPVKLNAGRQVDEGLSCLGCSANSDPGDKDKYFRIKYMTEELSEHIASHGQIVRRMPGYNEFMHVTQYQITP